MGIYWFLKVEAHRAATGCTQWCSARANGGVGTRHSSIVPGVFTVDRALLYELWEPTGTDMVAHMLRWGWNLSRWAISQQLCYSQSYVPPRALWAQCLPVGHLSRLLVFLWKGQVLVSSCGLCHSWRQSRSPGCSSNSGSRCSAMAIPVPDFSRSVPTNPCWWHCKHSTCGTSRLITCIPTIEEGVGAVPTTVCSWAHTKGGRQHHRAPVEEYAVAPLPVREFQSCLPHTTTYKQIWGLLLQQLESRPCPQQDCDNHRGSWTFSVGSGLHTSHSPHQWDNG